MNSKRKEDNLIIILLSFVVADQGPCDQHIRPDARAAELLQETGGDYRYWTLRTVRECWMELFGTLSKFCSRNKKTDQTDRPKRLKQTETITNGTENSWRVQGTESNRKTNKKLRGGKQATDARKSRDKLDTRNIRRTWNYIKHKTYLKEHKYNSTLIQHCTQHGMYSL